jgi:phospholipase C
MGYLRLRTIVAAAGLAMLAATGVSANQWNLAPTAAPIKYLVVIFQENNSFDHYFGTYPYAPNPAGEPTFNPLPGTPRVNGYNDALLKQNPNSAPPFRLDRSQYFTCDNDNHYSAEQSGLR